MELHDLVPPDGAALLEPGGVRLRQPPSEPMPALRRVDRLIAGAPGARQVEALAAQLAAFHAAASGGTETAARPVHEMLEDRVERLARALGFGTGLGHEGESAADAIRFLRAFLRGHGALFEARVAAGRVHARRGVLLRHLWFEPARGCATEMRAGDNTEHAAADVACDVADLTNDLAVTGRHDLAERFLAQYLVSSDDYQLLQVLPFYAALRALERSLDADDGDPRAWLASRALLERAQRATHPRTEVPALVVVGGSVSDLRGEAAAAAASALGAPCLRIEELLHQASAARGDGSPRPDTTDAADRDQPSDVYAAAMRRAQLVLASGRSCVIEGGFRSAEMRAAARALAQRADAGFRFVDCRPSSSEHVAPSERWPQPFMSTPSSTRDLCAHEQLVLGGDNAREHTLAELRAALRPWRMTGAEP